MKTCEGCRFYDPAWADSKCYKEANCYAEAGKEKDIVTGEERPGMPTSPYIMRADVMKCGPNGDWWMAKN